MSSRTKDWLAVGLPLLVLRVVGVAARANCGLAVLVTMCTRAALAGLGGLERAGVPVAAGQGAERLRARVREAG
jgi:hypothetical protein